MKVLVIGGTRFFGRALVECLARDGAEVAVLSRRAPATQNVEWIEAERTAGLARLRGRRFDAAVDALCYRKGDLAAVLEVVDAPVHAVISTAWLGAAPDPILEVTSNYLRGKQEVEVELMEARRQGRSCVAVRPPIMLGHGDHTGRLAFYCHRIASGGPVLAIDGGANVAQIAWHEDVATALAAALARPGFADAAIREALPDEGRTVRRWIETLAGALGVAPDIVAKPAREVAPDYLEREPLWRERAQKRTRDNLFAFAKFTPTAPEQWLKSSVLATGRRVA